MGHGEADRVPLLWRSVAGMFERECQTGYIRVIGAQHELLWGMITTTAGAIGYSESHIFLVSIFCDAAHIACAQRGTLLL